MQLSGFWLVSYISLWILFIVVSIVLVSVLRNLGVIYQSLERSMHLEPAPTKLSSGQKLPDLILQGQSGEEVSLSSLNGREVAISIVGLRCSACTEFLRAIANGESVVDPLDDSLKERIIIGIGEVSEVRGLIRNTGLDDRFPILFDALGTVEKEWGITSIPTTVIVDKDWKVVRQLLGS